ncbi:hypothetical protein B0T21DRAFT_422610 [Apiosordaria backusii]|uniref:Uncharacterized protein n=1 Tax=Apiosordaria backusii TaxID=314023 RepID=A0AA40AXA4_9PEZI|nr:hypothetical protein B0T21DRAFT_422610 [Apiosordaria backusii]
MSSSKPSSAAEPVNEPTLMEEIGKKIRTRRADVFNIIASKIPEMKDYGFAAKKFIEAENKVHDWLYTEGWTSTSVTDNAVASKGLVGMDYIAWLVDSTVWATYKSGMDQDNQDFPYQGGLPDQTSKPTSEHYLKFCQNRQPRFGDKRQCPSGEATPIAKRLKELSEGKEPAEKEEWWTQNAWKTLYFDATLPVKEHVFALPLEKEWDLLVAPKCIKRANGLLNSCVEIKIYDTEPKRSIGVMFTSKAKYKSAQHLRDLHELWVMMRGWHSSLGMCMHFQTISKYIETRIRDALEEEVAKASV